MPRALHETITDSPSAVTENAKAIEAEALRAAAWAGEPFLRPDEDVTVVLAPGTARRRALDDASKEIADGAKSPSAAWKIKYALLLGLERVLSEKPPKLADGTELRRHQVDALAGMLTELISAVQKSNGNGGVEEPPEEEDDEPEDELDGASKTVPRRSRRRTSPRRRPPRRIPAPRAATASATRPHPARRSPPPASSRRRAPKAS